MRHARGFTLMELVIVVALILIIAAITIPSLTTAKINANEASAVGSIRAINQAEVQYCRSTEDMPIRWQIWAARSLAPNLPRPLACWIKAWLAE